MVQYQLTFFIPSLRVTLTHKQPGNFSSTYLTKKYSCVLYIEQEFSHVTMEQFPDVSSYCQYIKSLSDQLANIGN